MADSVAAHVMISGKVQGVCFRWETQKVALKNRVQGWVRNLPDGSVEAHFEGDRDAVSATIDWCRQGPVISRVENVAIDWKDATGEFDGFQITR
jgi:acylphosphatase